ncbi:MAG TPA: prepilin peptidase [Galbitalea sp.]|nr:prepilin peptidase [Galbitalea sp.]
MRRIVLLTVPALPFAGIGVLAIGITPSVIALLYLAGVTPWLVWFDARAHRLPNVLVVPGIGVGLLACAGEWVVSGRVPVVPLVAGVAYAGFLFILNLLGGMGMGDVKLGTALGLASGTVSVAVLPPVVAVFAGGLVSVILLARGRRGRKIAFGPFLLGGFWAAVLVIALARLWR